MSVTCNNHRMLLLYYYRMIEKHKKILFNICLLTKLSKTYD